MRIKEYNSFQNSLKKIIQQQQKMINIFANNAIMYQQTQLSNYIKSITPTLTSIVNNSEYQQLLANTSRLTEIINESISPQLKVITNAVYDNLLNCDFSALKTLQSAISSSNISDLHIDSLCFNENGAIIYEDESFTPEEINNSTSELMLKATTGTIDFSDIKKHPTLSISLLIIMYIIFNLVIPDIYSSAKQYIKNNYFSNNSEIREEDYSNFRIITTDILNVRRNPSTDSDIIGKLYYLNVVKVTDTCPYWLRIEYIDSTNNIQITGWISKKYTADFSQESEKLFNLNNN